ncbi:hypothetical protein M405DRAFT_833931 [Rhizopogon salebrosus TDB-379]|nr:hypothetical protein M405DRAFT_833931 [Rhizopogon salebrosus TDB-379]
MLPVSFYLLLTDLVYRKSPTLLLPQYKQAVRQRWIHLRMVILLTRIHRYKDRQGYHNNLSLGMVVNPGK